MSFFFSLKHKLGFISLVLLALNFAMPYGNAKSSEENIAKKVISKAETPKDLLFLSIHKIADLYYVVMVEKLLPLDEENTCNNFPKAKKNKETFEFSIPLSASRKDVNAFKQNIRKLTSPCHTDFPQE